MSKRDGEGDDCASSGSENVGILHTDCQHNRGHTLARDHVHYQAIHDQSGMPFLQEDFEWRSDIADLEKDHSDYCARNQL